MKIRDFKYTAKKETSELNLRGKIRLKVLVVFSLMSFGMIFAQLVFANNLATDGQKLSDVYVQIEKLEDENTKIKVEITKNSSLVNLSKEADQTGFKKPEKVITP